MRADLLRRAAAELCHDDLVDDAREDSPVLLDERGEAACRDDPVVVEPGGFVVTLVDHRVNHDGRTAAVNVRIWDGTVLEQHAEDAAMAVFERHSVWGPPLVDEILHVQVSSRGDQSFGNTGIPVISCLMERRKSLSILQGRVRTGLEQQPHKGSGFPTKIKPIEMWLIGLVDRTVKWRPAGVSGGLVHVGVRLQKKSDDAQVPARNACQVKSRSAVVISSIHLRASSEEHWHSTFVPSTGCLVQGTSTIVFIVLFVHVVVARIAERLEGFAQGNHEKRVRFQPPTCARGWRVARRLAGASERTNE